MSDRVLRDLERRWLETESPADHAALIKARVRAGDLPAEALQLYASVGNLPQLGAPVTGLELLTVAWACIEHWLARAAPNNLANLSEPADPAAIASLGSAIGVEIPLLVAACWARHDGQVSTSPGLYEEFWSLLGVSGAIREWEMLTDLFDGEDVDLRGAAKTDPDHPPGSNG